MTSRLVTQWNAENPAILELIGVFFMLMTIGSSKRSRRRPDASQICVIDRQTKLFLISVRIANHRGFFPNRSTGLSTAGPVRPSVRFQ